MIRPEADRDLLFGIVALQAGLIDADRLAAALDGVVDGRGRTVEEVLARDGLLSEEDRRAIAALLVAQAGATATSGVGRSLARFLNSRGEAVTDDGRDTVHEDDEFVVVDAEGPASVFLRPIELGPCELDPTAIGQGPADRGAEAEADRGAEAEPAGPGDRGRFEVVRPLAMGGLGVVSIAVDRDLNRQVALKEIRRDRLDVTDGRARFVLEARLTGRLEHPGIVPVYGFGHDERGRPYYAMRLIRGETLAQASRRHRREAAEAGRRVDLSTPAFRELLRRFIAACEAVAYAHSRGVIHRDLKPGNIMLGPYGETLVVDWGLARPIGGVPIGAGAAVGTPGYMSPEQRAGDSGGVGPASDVYGLGATLTELLTGAPPTVGDPVASTVEAGPRGGPGPAPRPAVGAAAGAGGDLPEGDGDEPRATATRRPRRWPRT